jgi:putative phage-type endonuclease
MSEKSLSNDSESDDSEIPFYQENELNDLITSIHDYIEEYLPSEVFKMSKLDFHKDMVEDIAHVLFQHLQDAGIYQEDNYNPLLRFVELYCHEYFENKEDLNYPMRSEDHFKGNFHYEKFGLDETFVVEYIAKKLTQLRVLNQSAPKQRTPEWYKQRYNMMTASNLWQALSTESQRNRFIYEKCRPLDFGYTENKWINTDNPLHWGVKYEPLTCLVYEKITGANVEEFGCIQHEKYPFLGASPDGIVTNIESPFYGRMLEIKNIYNREMDGIPSEAYWIQIQMQLECCNLDVCDFVETRFKEYASQEEFFQEQDRNITRGIILHFIPKDGKSNVPVYKYIPFDIAVNENAIDEWISQCKIELPEHAVYVKIYWYLDEIMISTVERNSKWFEAALPILKETWATIERERVTGYEHRAAKKRIINDVIIVSAIDGSESHMIQNMPVNNCGICLIKIDSDEK